MAVGIRIKLPGLNQEQFDASGVEMSRAPDIKECPVHETQP